MITHSEKISENIIYSIVENISVISDDIVDRIKMVNDDNEAFSIYAPSSIAKYIVKYLILNINNSWFHKCSINKLLFLEDTDVVITVYGDKMIFVEEARYNGIIKDNSDSEFTYVYDSFKKTEVDTLGENDSPILVFGLFD